MCGHSNLMFLFFSNRFGCLPSLVLSVLVTLVLLWVMGAFR